MSDTTQVNALLVMLIGAAIVLAALIRDVFARLGVPALVGYVGLGLLLRVADSQWGVLNEAAARGFDLLASLGIVALLFKVGLESHPAALAEKLPQATVVWLGNMGLAAAAGFVAAYYVVGLGLVTALVVAVALTATSVGVAVAVWEEAGALDSSNGQLLVDVAELDDISGVALMALLLAVVPLLNGGDGELWGTIGATAAGFLAKFALFAGLCYLFAHYMERSLIRIAARLERLPGRMLTVVGVGMIIAAAAGWLGFSLAIGALFAGLVFSRDPEATKTERSFIDLYEFLTPFFFIGIGLQMEPAALGPALDLGLVLLVAAVLGKVVGAALPALLITGTGSAVILGLSMVPRAEIAMVVVYEARRLLGARGVPDAVYGAMAVVSVGTSVLAPIALRRMFNRWPQT